jgi:hypothetical protein
MCLAHLEVGYQSMTVDKMLNCVFQKILLGIEGNLKS